MTNNPNCFQRELKIKAQRLEAVKNFKYLGSIISNECSKPQILSRIAQTTAALSRLKSYGRTRTSRLLLKLSWCGLSSYPLYACESWTLTAELERRIQALEMRCYRRLFLLHFLQWPCDERGGLQPSSECNWSTWWSPYHGEETEVQIVWAHLKIPGMEKSILVGDSEMSKTTGGRQKKRWEDNIKEGSEMGFGDSLRAAEDREMW